MDSAAIKSWADNTQAGKALRKFRCVCNEEQLHELAELANTSNELYTDIEIPKGNGKTRHIQIPHPLLKSVQQQLVILFNQYPIYNPVYGFRPKNSAPMGLRMMLNKYKRGMGYAGISTHYQLDIQDFFPSITETMIRNAVRNCLWTVIEGYGTNPLDPVAKKTLEDGLTTICAHENKAPQGAPTSPMLSNIVAKPMDNAYKKLFREDSQFCGSWGRYADDIVLLLGWPLEEYTSQTSHAIPKRHGFKLADEKTKTGTGMDDLNIWGMDVLPPKDPYAEKTHSRFRVPKQKVSEIERKMCALSESIQTGQGDEEARVKLYEITGLLSYAANVGKYGLDTPAKNITYLPKRLEHAWKYLLRNAAQLLPKNAPHWFGKQKDDDVLFM